MAARCEGIVSQDFMMTHLRVPTPKIAPAADVCTHNVHALKHDQGYWESGQRVICQPCSTHDRSPMPMRGAKAAKGLMIRFPTKILTDLNQRS